MDRYSVFIGAIFVKFIQLILKKIIKSVATRCQILRLKCTKLYFGWGSNAPPYPLAGFKGPTSKGRRGERNEWREGSRVPVR